MLQVKKEFCDVFITISTSLCSTACVRPWCRVFLC